METIDALKILNNKTDAKVFLTGGFVRDYIRKKDNQDLDVVLCGMSLEKAAAFLKQYGKYKIIKLAQIRDKFDFETLLFRAHNSDQEAQITLPRQGKLQIANKGNLLKHDARCRDFAINALFLPINFKSVKDVIDYVGGMGSIKNRVINPVTTAGECLTQSPIRMLRAVRLAATTDYRLTRELKEAIKNNAELILKVPPEVIRNEFNKILLSQRPSFYIKLMLKLNLLNYFLPELARCSGVSQDDRYHKHDVFTHCVNTVDFLEKDIVLRLAGLLHDIGKVDTRNEIIIDGEKHVTFHKHEIESVRLAKTLMDRLRYDRKTRDSVLNLVRMHMYHYTRDYSDVAVRRFIKRAEINRSNVENLREFPLFKLRAAERQGNGLKRDPITQRQIDFETRIKNIIKRGADLTTRDLQINGHVLMEAFGLKPGKIIGEILDYLLEEVQKDKEKNNRLRLIELSIRFIEERQEKMKIRKVEDVDGQLGTQTEEADSSSTSFSEISSPDGIIT